MLAEFRSVAAGTQIPPPLVDSPKCPRCSLVGICLPDEVVYLQTEALGDLQSRPTAFVDEQAGHNNGSAESQTSGSEVQDVEDADNQPASALLPRSAQFGLPVRRLVPALDNALPFYVRDNGVMLGKSGDRLQVKKHGEVIGERRLIDVSQVSLFGSVIVAFERSSAAKTPATARRRKLLLTQEIQMQRKKQTTVRAGPSVPLEKQPASPVAAPVWIANLSDAEKRRPH